MINRITLLLFIGLALWSCSKEIIPTRPTINNIEYLRYWEPNEKRPNYGAELLYTGEIEYGKIYDIISVFNKTYGKAVMVDIYTSKEAYLAGINQEYGDIFNEGFILGYVKNLTNRGAYRGFNEIRWMQEKGELSHLFGSVTTL